MAVRREYVESLYRDLLGREGSPGEVEGHLNNPSEQDLYNLFTGSPEYTSSHGGTATWADVGGVVTPTQPANTQPPPSNPYQLQGDGGGVASNGDYGGGGAQGVLATTGDPAADRARAKAGLASVYQQFIGRNASDAELENWLSGRYGYGSGVGDYDKMVAAIMGSQEARNYRPGGAVANTNPDGSYQDLEWWQRRGVPGGDIFDPTTGQLRPGWERTGNGYERRDRIDTTRPDRQVPTLNSTTMHGFSPTNFNDPNMQSMKYQFARIASRFDPTQAGALERLMNDPEFRRAFPNARMVGHDSIDFGGQYSDGPNRGVPVGLVDVGEMFRADRGGPAWQWLDQRNVTSGAGGGGAAGGGVTQRTSAGGAGAGGTVGDIRSLYQAAGQYYGGPGGQGITSGPLQQVGQDPFSYLLTGGLGKFLEDQGTTEFGLTVQDALQAILERGGNLDDRQIGKRYESARELLDKGRRTMIGDLRGDLAERNLLSEPGIPQGEEINGLNRVTERLAPEFSRALRDIYEDESAQADARLMSSLQLAAGFSTDQARNFLAGVGEGTARQVALSDLALRSLQTNMAWSQFLAEFGLKRDQVLYEMQSGNVEQYLPLLQSFLQLGGMANAGYV